MRVDFFQEPELEFGAGRHIDIRFGLMHYGPLDYEQPLAPKLIKLGIVGTPETVEGMHAWLERCQHEIPAKVSKQPNLFPRFPGFNPEASFCSSLLMDQQLQREIPPRFFEALYRQSDVNHIVSEAVDLFFQELSYLAEKANGDVFVCAVPMELVNLFEQRNQMNKGNAEGAPEEQGDQLHLDFHDMLKARAMQLKTPIQVVLPRHMTRPNVDSRKSALCEQENPKMKPPGPGICIRRSIIKPVVYLGASSVRPRS